MAVTVRSSAGPSSQRQTESFYEAPTFSLNPTAQRQLAHLTQSHSLKKLNESLEAAQKQLTESAADINDRLTRKSRQVKKLQNASTRPEDEDDFANGEQGLEQMQNKVQSMTQRMDDSLRKLIDGQHNIQSLLSSIREAAYDARDNADTQASTQNLRSTRSRATATNRSLDEEAEEEEEDDQPRTFNPTDPAGNSRARPPLKIFREGIEHATTRYQGQHHTVRYGENNTYQDFKRVVHDALYPDDDVPLPHYTEWFQDEIVPAAGARLPGASAANGDDDDDDIAVSRATISTRCPITLQELKDPLTSRKCPHSFERSAILEMISASNTRVDAPQGHRVQTQRAVQCPERGCSQLIAKTDLHKDAVLMRKIRRIQRARQLQEEEEEDDDESNAAGTQRRTQIIEDDEDEGGADIDDLLAPEPSYNPKSEPRGTAQSHYDDEDVVMMSD